MGAGNECSVTDATSPGWRWVRRNLWYDWQGKPKYSKETGASVGLSTTSPTRLTRAGTQAAEVGRQRPTAWATPLQANKVHGHNDLGENETRPGVSFDLSICILLNLFNDTFADTWLNCRSYRLSRKVELCSWLKRFAMNGQWRSLCGIVNRPFVSRVYRVRLYGEMLLWPKRVQSLHLPARLTKTNNISMYYSRWCDADSNRSLSQWSIQHYF
jgi:hypothetical protein